MCEMIRPSLKLSESEIEPVETEILHRRFGRWGGELSAEAKQAGREGPLHKVNMALGRGNGSSRNRALSALVQHAKATFEQNICDTRLVAPISPSPQDLIHT